MKSRDGYGEPIGEVIAEMNGTIELYRSQPAPEDVMWLRVVENGELEKDKDGGRKVRLDKNSAQDLIELLESFIGERLPREERDQIRSARAREEGNLHRRQGL